MADVEPRHHGHRGGGYHGGGGGGRGGGRGGYYNNRKRRFRDDDDMDRRPQRRRYEEPAVVKVKRQMLGIAESPMRNAQDEASGIAQLVADNYNDEDIKNVFLQLVKLLTVEQPMKIPFVAAIILYANEKNGQITSDVLSLVAERAQAAIKDGAWRSFKLLLRLVACLQDVLEGEGVFPILEDLFGQAVDLQTASSDDALGLELVKIILLTIPYLVVAVQSSGNENTASLQQRALDLLEKTDIIASTPHALEAVVESYLNLGSDSEDDVRPFATQSELHLLQKQMQTEAKNDWQFACIPRAYKRSDKDASKKANGDDGGSENEAEAEKHEEKTVEKHALPSITISSPINPGPLALFPTAFFSLYADQDVESVPRATDIASSLIRDVLVDTINSLDVNRGATARYLIEMDCFWAPNTFVKRAVPFDRLREMALEDNVDKPARKSTTWKPEDLAIDAVFSQIFMLPQPEHKLVYYHSVVTDACKIAPAAIAPSLGRAIRFLFKNVDAMDLESSYRFLDWFAHHLSNFEFRWKWSEWADEVEHPDIYPKKSFIVATIDKEIRLSFAKRIRETLPGSYHHLIPAIKEKDIPDFKFKYDETRYASEGRELLQLLRKKAPETDIQPVLDRIEAQAADSYAVDDPVTASTDAYVTCLCSIGAKSLSHVLSCIERCKERLIGLGASHPESIIDAVVAFWANQPGNAVSIVDKLLNYTILSPQAVIAWALTSSSRLRIVAGGSGMTVGAHPLARAWLYEMVSATVNKVSGRVCQVAAARITAAANAKSADEEQQAQQQEAAALLDETLSSERVAMRELFKSIEDALTPVANGLSTMESSNALADDGGDGGGSLTSEEREKVPKLIRAWAQRWTRAFGRKAIVQDALVGEAAMATKISVAEALRAEEMERARLEELKAVEMKDGEMKDGGGVVENGEAGGAAAEGGAGKEGDGDTVMA